MGMYSVKVPNVDPVLAADANILRDKFIGLGTATSSPTTNEVEYRSVLRMHRFYSGSEFSGVGNQWYLMNAGGVDNFTRSDSAAIPGKLQSGQSWVPKAGTWGISSNKGYSVTDASDDMMWFDSYITDPTAELTMSGTIASSSNYRHMALIFRGLDTSNFLMVQLFNGTVQLLKKDAGSFTSLSSVAQTTTDGTAYTLTASNSNTTIIVYVNGTSKITYGLATGEFKYLEYTRVGINLRKAGSPGTVARATAFKVRQAVA